MTHSKGDPEKKSHSKPWYKEPSTLISLGAMVIALVSAGTSIIQANTAKQQNTGQEQQELVTLVTSIASDSATIAEQSLTFQNNPSAAYQAANGTEYTELADSEEAVNIIGLLNGNGVTATDYFEVALGLEPSDSYAQALNLLSKAVNVPADPRTRASILRTEAQIYYELGVNSEAERDDAIAEQVFNHLPDVTKADQENNVADTEFFDAWHQAAISCSTALAEVSTAEEIFTANLSGMFQGTTNEYANATRELQDKGCVQKTASITSPVAGSSIVVGAWEGSYVCQQGVIGLLLNVTSAPDDGLTAIFTFFPISGNSSVSSGSFTMTGTYSAAGVFFTPDHWISQPRGYPMVILAGRQPGNGKRVFSGNVITPGCTTFFVQRQ